MLNFKEIERGARKVWKKNRKKIKKSIQNNPKKKLFSFLEGPPTANAPPALHHLEVRTFKDIICKFRFMQGFSVPRKGGWDCHGLPVEVQVEKQLGLNSKKDILRYGQNKFIKKCKSSVFSNISDWEKSTEELNYLIDLEYPYRTLDNDYVESVWWSLKELYKKKLLYEDYKVVPFCPRCGTPLSSHEVAQGYKDVKEDSVYIAFKLKKPGEHILAWTTTPWTLPGNVGLAVGKDIEYVKVQLPDGDKLILGKDRLNILGKYKIIEKFKGRKLEGLEYEPLFNIKELQNKNSHKVMVLSHYMKNKLIKTHKIFEKCILVNPGGVDLERFRPLRNRILEKKNIGLPKDHIHLLTIRNLEPRMGLDNLLKSIRILKQKRVKVYLTIGGEGPEKENLKKLIKRFGLVHEVTMAGFIPAEQLPKFYAASDFFILPTRALEGFGLVTPESLACGTPVLGTPIGGTKEILSHFNSQLLFKDTSPEAIAHGIEKSIENYFYDKNKYKNLRDSCRQHAEMHYSWTRHISQLKTLISVITNHQFPVFQD